MASAIGDYCTWNPVKNVWSYNAPGVVAQDEKLRTNKQPALFPFLYGDVFGAGLAYKGDHSNTMYYTSGVWVAADLYLAQYQMTGGSDEAVACTLLPNMNIMSAYQGINGNEIWVSECLGDPRDGPTAWSAMQVSDMPGGIAPECKQGPTLAVFKGIVYMAYLANNDSNQIMLAWLDNGTWYGNVPVASLPGGYMQQSSKQPVLIATSDTLILAYKGAANDNIYLSWYDGTSWQGDTPLQARNGNDSSVPQSSDTPSIGEVNGRLMLVYKGASNDNIYCSVYSGSSLSSRDDWIGDVAINTFSDSQPRTSGSGPVLVPYLNSQNVESAVMYFRGSYNDEIYGCTLSTPS